MLNSTSPRYAKPKNGRCVIRVIRRLFWELELCRIRTHLCVNSVFHHHPRNSYGRQILLFARYGVDIILWHGGYITMISALFIQIFWSVFSQRHKLKFDSYTANSVNLCLFSDFNVTPSVAYYHNTGIWWLQVVYWDIFQSLSGIQNPVNTQTNISIHLDVDNK